MTEEMDVVGDEFPCRPRLAFDEDVHVDVGNGRDRTVDGLHFRIVTHDAPGVVFPVGVLRELFFQGRDPGALGIDGAETLLQFLEFPARRLPRMEKTGRYRLSKLCALSQARPMTPMRRL